MRTSLIRIGNSRGLRLPKPVLEAAGLTDEVELTIEPGRLIVVPAQAPRAGWEQRFKAAPVADDDEVEPLASRFDEEEWTW